MLLVDRPLLQHTTHPAPLVSSNMAYDVPDHLRSNTGIHDHEERVYRQETPRETTSLGETCCVGEVHVAPRPQASTTGHMTREKNGRRCKTQGAAALPDDKPHLAFQAAVEQVSQELEALPLTRQKDGVSADVCSVPLLSEIRHSPGVRPATVSMPGSGPLNGISINRFNATHAAWAISYILQHFMEWRKPKSPSTTATTDAIRRIVILAFSQGQVSLYRSVLRRLLHVGCVDQIEHEMIVVSYADNWKYMSPGDCVIVDLVNEEDGVGAAYLRSLRQSLAHQAYWDVVLFNEAMEWALRQADLESLMGDSGMNNVVARILCCRRCLSPLHSTSDCQVPGELLQPCEYCKNPGHVRAECRTALCRNCHIMGHVVGHCPRSWLCQNCGSDDHKASNCDKKGLCSQCWHPGHHKANCKACAYCLGNNHRSKACPQGPRNRKKGALRMGYPQEA